MVIFREKHRGHLRGHRVRGGIGRREEVPRPVQADLPEAVREDPLPRVMRHRPEAASKEGTERLFRAALQYAIVNKRKA